ncbi:PAS/PAC sensor hybrid histidine kinase [Stanieria sp. NIES-3757]|nr:PAS/PAC sensor hybrid histidine kinase [Stanieria sp. NIES-3757]
MRRDANGKFTNNWESEAKRRVSVTLTNTAWRLLEEEAQKYGISRSEVIERIARSFATAKNRSSETKSNNQGQKLSDKFNVSDQNQEAGQNFDQADTRTQELIWKQQQKIDTLERQKQELEAIVENAPDAIAHFDSELRYLYVNRIVEQALGIARDDLLGKKMDEVLSNPIYLFWEERLRQVFATTQAQEIEFEFETPFGVRFYQARLVPELNSDGLPVSVIVISRDMTETRQAEQQRTQLLASQETKRKIEVILESISDAFVAFDRNWRYTYVNQAAATILHKKPAELLGKHVWNEVFPELVGGIAYQKFHQAIAEQIPISWEEFGEPIQRWIEVRVYPSSEGIAVYFRDVTERKQAEQALRNTAERLSLALAAANLGDWSWDAATDLVNFSQRAAEIFGILPGSHMTWTQMRNLLHEDDRERARVEVEKAIANHSDYSIEYRVLHQDGSERWVAANGRANYSPTGEALGMLGIVQDITQRKQAEQALRESQILYQTLAEALPNLIWTLTPDGQIDYVNQQWRKALGVTLEQVNQTGWSLIVHPDDLPRSFENWTQIQSGESITEQEYRHYMADGSYRWFLARMFAIRDQYGQLLRLVGASTDIDERKRTEDALRSSEERLALASQAAQVVTFEWNIETNQVFWTAEEEALYGLTPGSFQGQLENWKQAVHPEDRDRAVQDVLDAVANRTDLNTEFRIIHPDGNVRWLAAKGRTFYDTEDRPLRMIGMNEDITERKQLEMEREQLLQQLEASLGQFEAVINSMSEGLLVSDAQGNVLLFNPAALVLHEYDSVEQVRRHLCEFPDTFEGHDLQGNLIELEDWPLARVLRGETYRDYEINVHRLDTHTRWIGSFSGTPVYDKQGQMILAIVTMHDISDRKQAETERLQLLQQERKAREQAEAANCIKDQFLAVLSHELRTPLNPILGWSHLLRQGKLDAKKTSTALETIERNAKLQIQLIDDLLDISRILQGKLSLTSVPVDLKSTITAAIETVYLAAQTKDIQIQTQFESQAVTVLGDAARLQQVVWNLLTNAVKFTPATGQIQIRLSTTDFQAQIQVRDTGKGIRPEFLPYVFDRFCQADSTTTRTFGGLGLGLAIVRHLVELHGGMVKAESNGEGQGATFTIMLPLMSAAVSTTEEAVVMTDSLQLQGINILAVDDDVDNLELVQFILEQAGATVMTTSHATEALEQLHQSNPHLIITDIAMPQVDGYTLMKQIRELTSKQGRQIPAIALTAYAGEINQQKAIAVGFQIHLAKPVDPQTLVQAISELLSRT